MPEPTPTVDVAPGTEGKKIPKWGYIAIIGVGVVGLLWYKNKRKKEEENQTTFQPAETGGQNLEQTIPGGSGVYSGGIGATLQEENTKFLERFLESEQEKAKVPTGNGREEAKKGNQGQGGQGNNEKGYKPEQGRKHKQGEPPVESKEKTSQGEVKKGKNQKEPEKPIIPKPIKQPPRQVVRGRKVTPRKRTEVTT